MATVITQDVLETIDYVRMLERPLSDAGLSSRNVEMITPVLRRQSEFLFAAGFGTLERIAHFLGQTAYESKGYQVLAENLDYSVKNFKNTSNTHLRRPFNDDVSAFSKFAGKGELIANRIYSGTHRPELGNGDEASGEGWLYRGKGILQITGKANYHTYGQMVGVDLVSDPDLLIEDLDVSVAVAAAFFKHRGIHAPADRNDFPVVTRLINGGQHGLAVRAAITEAVLINLKGAYAPSGASGHVLENPPEGLKLHDKGAEVRRLQTMLNDLDFPVGVADGKFGNRTYSMLVSFQARYGLAPHGIATRQVFSVLQDALNAKPVEDEPNHRSVKTAKKMRDAGIKEPQDAAAVSTGSVLVGGTAAAGVADEAGIIDAATNAVSSVADKGEGAPNADAVVAQASSGPSLFLVLALLLVMGFAFWMYARSRRIKASSMKAFEEGRYLR